MSTATFSLYANAQPTLWRLLVCTIGGGLLGVAGQRLGYLSEPRAGSNPTPALFIVWQTGMGFVIGSLLADERGSRADAAVDRRTEGDIGESQSALEGGQMSRMRAFMRFFALAGAGAGSHHLVWPFEQHRQDLERLLWMRRA